MFELFIKCILAYLLGSILGSLVVGQLRGGIDIRQHGSGNAGGTNALRTQGMGFAFWVFLIDIGKGWLAVNVIAPWSLPFIVPHTSITTPHLSIACASAVVLGHVYPVWHHFRGGKGAATLLGILIGLMPAALPYVLSAFVTVLLLSGFVSLSTMTAATSFPIWIAWQQPPDRPLLLAFAIGISVFTYYTHRSNIARLYAGTEHRLSMPWHRKTKST